MSKPQCPPPMGEPISVSLRYVLKLASVTGTGTMSRKEQLGSLWSKATKELRSQRMNLKPMGIFLVKMDT